MVLQPPLVSLLAAALLALGAGSPVPARRGAQKLLLVSFDGFRWNYDQEVETPNLDAMALEGVKAQHLTPAFVTITSPCHFTLLTGKYIENHGVIHNMYFNTTTKVKLPYYPTQGVSSWWDNGSLPIWITAQRQGLKTGSLFFPGGNATYQGEEVNVKKVESPTHKWDNDTEWRANVETVMKWFTEDDLDFVALYFGEPDSTGHKHGPDSSQRKAMVSQLDRILGYIRNRITHHGLASKLNLILTADHGMRKVMKKPEVQEIILGQIPGFSFKDIEFDLVDYGPTGLLLPKEGKLEQVYEALKKGHPHLNVYKKEELPEALHYSKHPRILPLVVFGDPGYVVHGRIPVQFNKGEHGFDNNDMDMKTIFRAVGPAFKSNLKVEPFESVHVYALMCELLGIRPETHDGSLEKTWNMLVEAIPSPSTGQSELLFQVTVGLASVTGVLLLIFIPSIIVTAVRRKNRRS
ncbi:hypothetical protein NDU88_007372 [Pleurodeles waltl]|uniref:Ectonucleotide pyrophosphatase/phosphodiesterase 7 n=1 Tax=Pleurodeles waltl TaxID=8319 RepID=A0AAV7PLF7_PLEWA|nr:hypothetical protein NDU88_007372 [Pleurodeles waltl]